MIEGCHAFACSKSNLNCFSDSPTHLFKTSAPFLRKNATGLEDVEQLAAKARAIFINLY